MQTMPQTQILAVNPKLERGTIFPIFIPFAGCPHHCIFCAQEQQTGAGRQSVAEAVAKANIDFPEFLAKTKSSCIDMAFYGGTFTAIGEDDFFLCLAFFGACKELAKKNGITLLGRCSTRPDALAPDRLQSLKSTGIDLIELGIQSFNDTVLMQSKRAYTGETAVSACQTVLAHGFKLGIQLMAGLPNQNQTVFLNDVQTALLQNPHCMRYYPCLVPEKTQLARLFDEGKYMPWSNETCIEILGKALATAWQARVPVIRLTVAPEQEFDTHLAAGPRHPGLGSDIMGYAFYTLIKDSLTKLEQPAQKICIPIHFQGCFFGTKNWLKKQYAELIPLETLSFEKKHSGQITIIY